MIMVERFFDFLKISLLSLLTVAFTLSICGGLMFLVSITLDGFMAGIMMGVVFGAGLYAYLLFAILHSFFLIFKK